jgi:formylglycine-generating enzyme required for sulfatase activity
LQAEEFTNSVGMKLIRIKAGTFVMGQERDPEGRNITVTYGNRQWLGGEIDEEPVHEVRISRPFHMSAT